MSNKPNWRHAPAWARYLAMDDNGTWYWYEKKPRFNGHNWVSESGQYFRAGDNGTLEERPE